MYSKYNTVERSPCSKYYEFKVTRTVHRQEKIKIEFIINENDKRCNRVTLIKAKVRKEIYRWWPSSLQNKFDDQKEKVQINSICLQIMCAWIDSNLNLESVVHVHTKCINIRARMPCSCEPSIRLTFALTASGGNNINQNKNQNQMMKFAFS